MHFNFKHGETIGKRSARYQAWHSMRTRCLNPHCKSWPNYGGRGIHICKRWDKYEVFAADMGGHPGKGYSLERKRNNGHYTPANCYWATAKEQRRNQRPKKITRAQAHAIRRRRVNGESGVALGQEFGIHPTMVYNIAHGRHWI